MALTKSSLRLNLQRRLSLRRPFYSSTSSDEEDNISLTEEDNISLSESTLAQKLCSLIKDHYRRHPSSPPSSPSPILSSLSLDFSRISPPSSLSAPVITHVIKTSASVRHGIPFHQILSFFNWAVVNPDPPLLAPEPYHHFINAAGKARMFDAAWGAIKLMKEKGLQIQQHTFLILIQRYVRAGLVAEALLTFNRMEEFGCEPDTLAFSEVITVLGKMRKAKQAQEFFDTFKDRFQPDVVAYTSLMNGWCRAGELAQVERVFDEMKTLGIQPNVYTYTVVLDALSRSGQPTRAHDVFADMLKAGVQPNAATFNTLMRVHVKAGRTEKVLQIHNQMKRLLCSPDVVTYNFLIESHCRDGNLDEAIKLLNMMQRKGCAPNSWSFNQCFMRIAKARDVNAAHRLFTRMQGLKCKPNTLTYNILMQMFAESRSADMVLKLKKEMDADGVEANVNTFKILISLFYAMGHWNNAYQYLREMVEEKCLNPPEYVYKMVLGLLRKNGQIKKHEELVEKMIRRGFVVRTV